jgi:nucleoside-diphosphate-sugar epimerase
MRVLVTGNLGYVGSVLTPMLADRGLEVWGFDTGFYKECLMGAAPGGVAKQITKDLRDVTADDLKGVEAVVHLAALSNDPIGELNPALTRQINLEASNRLAAIAKETGVSRFVFASSCSIYGQSDGVLTENSTMNPLTEYARSKVEFEKSLRSLASDAFSPVSLRNGTAFGYSPRLRMDVVVNNLTGWAVTTGQVKLLSDGRAWRPLVHVEDMGRAMLAALTAPRERMHDQIFNVGREEDNHMIRNIAEMVHGVVPKTEVTFAPGVSTDARDYRVSFAHIRERLPEFEPAWSVEKGVHQLYDAYQAHHLTYEQFNGPRYTRLKQLQHLMQQGALDQNLAWTGRGSAGDRSESEVKA